MNFDALWPLIQFLVPFAFMFGFVVALMLPAMIFMERKVSAYIQDRRGPNRANILGIRLFGMIHNIADVVKLLLKEDLEPDAADKSFFRLAPFIVMTIALMTMAVVPFGEPIEVWGRTLHLQIAPLNAGILYIFAISSLSVYGIILAGWSSGNKFSFLGAVRASSQMISYEVALGLSVIGILVAYGTTDMVEMVQVQGANPFTWGFFLSPLGCLLFLTALFAETNRMPFDLPEGESELVAGFHLEYSSFKFALFFMSEYVNMVVGAAIVSTLFFGGWQVPFLSSTLIKQNSTLVFSGMMVIGGAVLLLISVSLIDAIRRPFFKWGDMRDHEPKIFLPFTLLGGVGMLWLGLGFVPGLDVAKHTWFPVMVLLLLQISAFCAKTLFFSFFFIWVRWTLPRFRYDQVMKLGWEYMLPLGVVNVFLTFVFARLWLGWLR
ncbi:MAG: NADH-quinone oxidoreductase subunit H [Myxococcales bacterium]|nr:NADH-quinone oxidoreductase subunit H [Myxococcales bacterium]